MTEQIPFVSVVIPVKNDAVVLQNCLESLLAQTYPAEKFEIIIADGLSKDNSRDIARKFNARVIDNPKQVVVSGRNRGFEYSKGDIVVFSDADCVFERNWIHNAVKYFNDPAIAGITGLTLSPDDGNYFEKAVDFIFSIAGFLNSTAQHLRSQTKVMVKDLPGCHAFYRREILKLVMPIEETLLTAEDVWMNYLIRKQGGVFLFVQDVILWHKHRNSPLKFVRQIYRFAIGRLQVVRKAPELLNPLHLLVGCALFDMVLFGVLSFFYPSIAIILSAGILCFLGFVFLKTRSILIAINVLGAGVLFVFSWSLGFLKEMFFPMKEVKGK